MRIVQTVMVFVLIVAAASVASAQRGPIPAPLIREGVTEKISEHAHVIPDNSAPLIPNVAIVVGNRATLVVWALPASWPGVVRLALSCLTGVASYVAWGLAFHRRTVVPQLVGLRASWRASR